MVFRWSDVPEDEGCFAPSRAMLAPWASWRRSVGKACAGVRRLGYCRSVRVERSGERGAVDHSAPPDTVNRARVQADP